ncbi:testis-specific gene 10 isoform X1 [Pelobates cultripes]|uniref:Testis-specific gene 10 isoform X1 n=1 Tax=Pelobates cultripes TaxID=61616 RepID=A0AAD1R455_PELCU|nr:testis-specific gene 10 isoform X1 [Pelobates cultripes]
MASSSTQGGRRKISELQLKIDELQNTNKGLEQHILHLEENREVVNNQVEDLTRKNEHLCLELSEIDKLAEQLERDKDKALTVALQELDDSKNEIRLQQKTVEQLEVTIKNITVDANIAKEHLVKVENDLQEMKEENRSLNILLDQLQEDKNRLTKKVEKLEKTEKNTVLANEKRRTTSPSKLDAFVKTLEDERDHYKREADNLRKMVRGRSCSPKRTPAQLEPELKAAQERDALRTMLEKYERHMAEIQANVKVLTSERDKTNVLYEKAQQEVTRLRKELIRSPKTPKACVTAQSILRRVESERDSAISDLRRMTTERDSLRERLKISQETSINERAHLEQRVEELQSSLRIMENDCGDHKSKISILKDTVSSLENEIKILTQRAREAESELIQRKSQCDSLRLFNEKTENSFEETQRRLSLKLTELQLAQEKIVKLEDKTAELTSQSLSQREELSILKATISQLNTEKDSLIYSLDQKAANMSSLEKSISIKESTIESLRSVLSEMEDSARQSVKTVSSQEQDISRLRRQIDDISDELTRTGRDRELLSQEKSHLQDHLSKCKMEIQNQDRKLKEFQDELEDAKLKYEGSLTDIARLESAIGSKEKEAQELLDNCRRSNTQAGIWENKSHQLETECRSVKLDLRNAESECRRLKETVDSLQMEIDHHVTTEQSYKSQINSLNKAASKMEEEAHQIKAEKSTVLNDLASTRELCVKLDSSKELLNRQLSAKIQDMEQLQMELESTRSELELLRKQLASERIAIKNLESLLFGNQEKEYQSNMRAKELDSELQHLKEKLILTESKLGNQGRETAHLKNKLAQQSAELELTRRQLSTEQFERERAVKELQRHSYAFQTSSFLRNSPSRSPSRLSPDRSFQSPERRTRSPGRSLERSPIFRHF